MKRALFLTAAVAVFLVGCSSEPAPETPAATTPEPTAEMPAVEAVSWSQIETVMAKCTPCHGETEPKEKLDLRTYDSLMKGSEHGDVVVAGDAAGSMLVHSLRGTNGKKQMPMMLPPLPEEEIALVEAWINAGATQ